MKNLKKVLKVTFSLVMVLALTVIPVSAAEGGSAKSTQEAFKFSPEQTIETASYPCQCPPSTVYDLSKSPVISMTLPESVPYESIYSLYAFKTNTNKIVIKLTSDTEGFIRVSLMDMDTYEMVSPKTIHFSANSKTAEITFTNLTESKNYFFQFDNVGTTTVNMKAVVSGK